MTSSAPAPLDTAPASETFPGKGLGIAGLVLAFFMPLIGLILSIIAKSQSKKVGAKNTPATAGIWISIVLLVIGAILVAVAIAVGANAVNAAAEMCKQLGAGAHEVNGVTYTCAG